MAVRISLCLGVLPVYAVTLAGERPPAATPEARFVGDAPRTFSGVFPCADCEGIRLTLDLFPDRAYILRQEYLGKNRAAVDLGRWSVADDGKLTLAGGSDEPWLFRAASEDALRKLDARGEEIATALNYDLKREAAFRLIRDPVHLSGLYVRRGVARQLRICLTGQELPVGSSGDDAALEREYALRRKAAGEPLLVSVTGHFAEAPDADVGDTGLSFVVEQFEKAFPGDTCPVRLPPGMAQPVKTPAGRNWTLVTLHGQAVMGGVGRMAFQLKLETGGHHLIGFTGCNRLNGRYVLQGDGLTLSELSTTRMSCPGTAEKERAYLQMLGDVTGWKLSGDHLLLYGRKDVIAEFVEKEED
ncbi:MAG: META domain-containing protein [Acidithiobacillales bacterium]